MLRHWPGVTTEWNEPWRSLREIGVFWEGRLQHAFFIGHTAELRYGVQDENDNGERRDHQNKGPDHGKFFADIERVADVAVRPVRNQPPRFGHDAKRAAKPTPVSYTHLTLPTICSV